MVPREGGALCSHAKLTSNDFQCIPFILFANVLVYCVVSSFIVSVVILVL